MKNKSIISIFFIAIMMIFAGCSSEQDCSELDSTYTKYGWDDEEGQCVVVEELQEGICGNGVIEDGQTHCNCPEDVPETHPEKGCFGEAGEYAEFACIQQECVLEASDRAITETIQHELSNRDVDIRADFELQDPFVVSSDIINSIQTTLELYSIDTNDNIKDLTIRRITFSDSSGTRLARVEINEEFQNEGDIIEVEPAEISPRGEYETTQRISITLDISFTRESLDRDGIVTDTTDERTELTTTISRWTFINPDYYEEGRR